MHRLFCITALAIGILIGSAASHGQSFPNRVIRIIVSAPPGTAPDVTARTVAQRMSENLGSPVVVDNRAGGGGIPAVNAVSSAAADGYTVLLADTGVYSILPHVNPAADPLKSLAPVTLMGHTPLYLGVSATLGVSTVSEFLALARKKPGMAYASAGNGTASHLFMELLKSAGGINMLHVPHKGMAPGLQSMLAGDVVAIFTGVNLLVPQAKANKAKILGVAAPRRSKLMPDVAAIAEQLPGFDVQALTLGYLAPLGTPEDVLEKLRDEIAKATRADEVVQRLGAFDIDLPDSFSGAHFVQTIQAERRQYSAAIKSAGVTSK